MPRSKKTLPDALRADAQTRARSSKESLEKILCKIEASEEINSQKISIRDLMQMANLSPKYLYGKSIDPEFRATVISRVAAINCRPKVDIDDRTIPNEVDSLKEEILYWKSRYERLASNANKWFIEMRRLRRARADCE